MAPEKLSDQPSDQALLLSFDRAPNANVPGGHEGPDDGTWQGYENGRFSYVRRAARS